ncbi:unnamed protein product [Cylicocyclus nassatus]|uniref:Cocaine- and amphetamine-regulated transcript protein n=1 Tax=Cylicocyclus nassatus TaxID=53992 RepID=A0AA36DP84_CYLNA|nr:unnamed protein product [Cylicocyclus nassatus]
MIYKGYERALYLFVAFIPLFLCTPEDNECSLMAILSGRRNETESCNILSLLRQRVAIITTEKFGMKALRSWPKLRNKTSSLLKTCPGPGAVCRVNGKRTCICPPSYVCDAVKQSTMLYSCEKLKYFVQLRG